MPIKRNKPRTPAQKAATARLVALMKARRKPAKRKAVKRNPTPYQKALTRHTKRVSKRTPDALKYKVQIELPVIGWKTLAVFATLEAARQYGHAYQRSHPSSYLRVLW